MAGRTEDDAQKLRPKTSTVWEHFNENKPTKQVKCKLCDAQLSYHGSTTAMHEHLKRRHPGAVTPTRAAESFKQRRVDEFVMTRGSCTPQMATVLTQSILNMIVTDMRPIAMVEDDGFKQMIQTFHPGYTLPSRTHFTKLIEEKYETVVSDIKATLKLINKNKIALTADAWTSISTEAYLGITCHFISDDWELTSLCLTTMPLEERHTGSNIAAWIEEAMARFEISESNIVALVHDNGSNIVLAANILQEKHGWMSIRCAGHTLQLVINRALKHPQIIKTLGAARCLVEHFRKSELASSKLRAKQKQMGTPEHKLIQDVSTRWNSTFYMVTRLLEQRWPLTATLSDPTVTQSNKQYLDLKADQWLLLEELAKALEAFECATVYLSSESYVTVSALPPLVRGLLKSTHTTYDAAPVQAFQAVASEETTVRWTNEVTVTREPCTQVIAAALDPRFSKLKFLTPEDRFTVQKKVQALALQSIQGAEKKNASEADKSLASAERTFSALDSLLACDSSTDSDTETNEQDAHNQSITNEILMYFGQQPLSKTESPLSWWKSNEAKYPTLASLAKSFLCIPATSTPSERLFSAAGNIASKKRASLTPKHVDMLTFLHCNLHKKK
ncbi:zinc finger BED domain-containing protein 4-like isoform X2 [Cololabis saira]|uniref:zinc finger BED domain-containing protein 4-like isoform X2 n=1 Tax=Cololabis saira TaxID=129043 RepID=UPI002AD2DED0|nr:zinc finger BED domain-containing protein 4-like isoform X2 [Cololabis saira]